jgi:hypothetical protein
LATCRQPGYVGAGQEVTVSLERRIHPRCVHGQGPAGAVLRVRRHRAGGGPGQGLRGRLRPSPDKGAERRRRAGGSELREIGPPPYPNGRGYWRRWANQFEGADFFISSMLGLALAAPGYALRDVNDWFDGQKLSAERLWPEISALEAKALGGEFAVPIFVIQGAEDFTPPRASRGRSWTRSGRRARPSSRSREVGTSRSS